MEGDVLSVGLEHLWGRVTFNKMNIRITRYDHANHYDNEQLGLIIPKDKERTAFATVLVSDTDFKCIDVSRRDAKALLITMRKGSIR
tara:strand:- start:2692 stop:2952 length:261 start_codon:yes stop_codon:yes gene_type:complete